MRLLTVALLQRSLPRLRGKARMGARSSGSSRYDRSSLHHAQTFTPAPQTRQHDESPVAHSDAPLPNKISGHSLLRLRLIAQALVQSAAQSPTPLADRHPRRSLRASNRTGCRCEGRFSRHLTCRYDSRRIDKRPIQWTEKNSARYSRRVPVPERTLLHRCAATAQPRAWKLLVRARAACRRRLRSDTAIQVACRFCED